MNQYKSASTRLSGFSKSLSNTIRVGLIFMVMGLTIIPMGLMWVSDSVHSRLSAADQEAMEKSFVISFTEIYKPNFLPWTISLTILSGVFGGFYGHVSSRSKENLARLKESEEKYRALVDTSLDAICVLDADKKFIDLNPATESMLGYSKAELLQMEIADLIHPEDIPVSDSTFEKFNTEGSYADYEGRVITKSGQIKYISVSSTAIFEDGIITGSRDIIRDISKRKNAEMILAESNSLRELLLDIITHDLKNPASVILSMSEAARADQPDNELIENIYLSSERLLEVLSNTTMLSQAVFGEEVPKESLVLDRLLHDIKSDFSSMLETAGMELDVDIPQDIIINANPLIGEVFKNYISNAIKYARDGKRIIIEARIEDATVVVSVIDFGQTIAKESRTSVFERGIQLGDGEKSGRGLGLAIVKRIASAHQGEVWVEPNRPRGNRFRMRIPL